MLNFSAAGIYLCLEPTDMRKSFDTLAALVREQLQGDPQSGTWFVFRGKQGNRLKTFCWDRDSSALWSNRETLSEKATPPPSRGLEVVFSSLVQRRERCRDENRVGTVRRSSNCRLLC